MPKFIPLGSMEDALTSTLSHDNEYLLLPHAISIAERHSILTRLVMEWQETTHGKPIAAQHAAMLGKDLASLMDDMNRFHVDASRLKDLVPEAYASHWQQTLAFLSIITEHWPKITAEREQLDPIVREITVAQLLARRWEESPPNYPIMIAGSTGSQPITAEIMRVVSMLEEGRVILPGLDMSMEVKAWQNLEPTHPQYVLRQLLQQLQVARQQVQVIGKELSDRQALLQRALYPTIDTPSTHTPLLDAVNATAHMYYIECNTLQEEAGCAALLLREVLEESNKTAALVTADRTLARMISAAMLRYDIVLDDSGGMPLDQTVPSIFMQMIYEVVEHNYAPHSLLALLKHPLSAFGYSTATCRKLARMLEKEILRGVQPGRGMAYLKTRAANNTTLSEFLVHIAQLLQPIEEALAYPYVQMADILTLHMNVAEAVATTEHSDGSKRLWHTPQGETLAEALHELLTAFPALKSVHYRHYGETLQAFVSTYTYRPAYGTQPRLQILSPMEARLQSFDRVILAGLNEGTWPRIPEASPWMSRPMQAHLGLPPAEQRIGQSAHDFVQLASHGEVFITRSRRVEGAPVIASRWIEKIEHTLRILSASTFKWQENAYKYWVSQLDNRMRLLPINPPAPIPPLIARPRHLSVTEIDTLLTDPYQIYAKHVLGLRKLKPIDKPLEQAEFGTLIHKALEEFTVLYPSLLPEDALKQLEAIGQSVLQPWSAHPVAHTYWWLRFQGIAKWYINEHSKRTKDILYTLAEISGEWNISLENGVFNLSTRIDRLEIKNEKIAILVDYKTGTPPSSKDMASGLANQLLLASLIVRYGKLTNAYVDTLQINEVEYWKLSGGNAQNKITTIKAETLMENAKTRLYTLLHHYIEQDSPFLAVPNAQHAPRYNDYAHLERMDEWRLIVNE